MSRPPPMKHLTFHFDLISPFAYLEFEKLPEEKRKEYLAAMELLQGETLFERRPRKVVVVIVLRDVHGDDGFGCAKASCARFGDEGCELFGSLQI